jgi:regulator of protease activity HflC (stomatin/prohibitin superfamily)
MSTSLGLLIGVLAWFLLRYILTSFYTVNQGQRAVKTSFGRARRLGKATTLELPMAESLREDEHERYAWPQLKLIKPGGPYFKWPWERIYKVSVATETINMAKDLEDPNANQKGTMLEAVTKDQLNTGLEGQIRYRVSEQNLYAFLFGVKQPIIHTMGYFVAILRGRIAAFEAPKPLSLLADTNIAIAEELDVMAGISINDIRKKLSLLNDQMEEECASSEARYGILLDASLITAIDPPAEVESALAAINTAHNLVSSDVSLAQASADQKIVQSRRAVEIQTLNAYAEVEPLVALAEQLRELKAAGPETLQAYLRNVRLRLYAQAHQVVLQSKQG